MTDQNSESEFPPSALVSATEEGFAAGRAGKPKACNPYHRGYVTYNSWNTGYDSGYTAFLRNHQPGETK